MLPLDTHKITKVVSDLLEGLPVDKRLHFSASWSLCVAGNPVSSSGYICSFDLLKEAVDAFAVGVKKECVDMGCPADASAYISAAAGCIRNAFRAAKERGLTDVEHETDLLADMAGIGLFLLTWSLQGLNFYLADYEANKGEQKQ